MSDERWLRANALFEQILDLSQDERQNVLDPACADDPELRQAVEQRLRADAAAEGEAFLGQPIVPSPAIVASPDTSGLDVIRHQVTPPERLGTYRILHPIGQGGMGTVYAAERDDDAFHRQVAIKVITAGLENEEIVRRMQTERRILALLEHPNIARIYDAGASDEGLPYFVMEYVDGEPIDVYCANQGASIEERVALVRNVCAAVDYANRNLVVHRDLKPSNILVAADGEPKLLDFGIAKLLADDLDSEADSTQATDNTAPWRQRLTVNYASPEQLRGQTISTASDVYSLGVLLFQLLTGSLPRTLDGLSPWEAERRLTATEPPRPSTAAVERELGDAAPPGNRQQVSRQLQGDLDSIVLKALRTDSNARYASAGLLAEDLDRYLQGFPVQAHRGSWRYRTGKLLRRYRLAATLAASTLLLACAFVGSLVVSANNLARDQARLLAERSKLEQVLGIFLGIFQDASPYIAEGEDITVRQAVDRQANHLVVSFEQQPEILATMLSTLGWIYNDFAESDKAYNFHNRALALRRGFGADDIDIAESLDGIAASLRDQGQFDLAEELNASALTLYRSRTDIGPRPLLRGLNNRVELYCLYEEWKAADSFSEEALNLSRQINDIKDPEVSTALIQRAQVLNNLGDTLASRRSISKPKSPTRDASVPDTPFSPRYSITWGEWKWIRRGLILLLSI